MIRFAGDENGSGNPIEFNYDALSRLQSASGEAYEAEYTYDMADRLKHLERDGDSADFSYHDSRFPWAVTLVKDDSVTIGYTYDDDGIIISASTAPNDELSVAETTSFSFDARGLIRSAAAGALDRTTWEYDHQDRAVHKETAVGGRSTDYVDKYYENQPGINKSVKYLFFAGHRIAQETRIGPAIGLYYFHADQMGSIRYITRRGGEVVDTHYYYPYGEEYQSDGSTGIDFGFNDKKKEGYGLYRFPMRMYNPSGHQWVSLDPAVLVDPFVLILDGVNPYAYCRNDPVNRVDYTGQASQEENIKKRARLAALEAGTDYLIGILDSMSILPAYSEVILPYWLDDWGPYKATESEKLKVWPGLTPYQWGRLVGYLAWGAMDIDEVIQSVKQQKENERLKQKMDEMNKNKERSDEMIENAEKTLKMLSDLIDRVLQEIEGPSEDQSP